MGSKLLEDIRANVAKIQTLTDALNADVGAGDQINVILEHTQVMLRELQKLRVYAAEQQHRREQQT